LRKELLSNNRNDFGLRKGLDHLDDVRQKLQTITDRSFKRGRQFEHAVGASLF